MKTIYAKTETPGIKIVCPNCMLGSRYDASYLEDAIHDHTGITCVACGCVFEIVIQRQPSSATEK